MAAAQGGDGTQLDLLLQSAVDLQRFIQEYRWSTSEDTTSWALESAQRQLQVDESAVARAESALTAAESAARGARADRDATLARLHHLRGAQRPSAAALRTDKTAEHVLDMAKMGVHSAESLLTATRNEEKNSKTIEKLNASIQLLRVKSKAQLDEAHAALGEAQAALTQERVRAERQLKMIKRCKKGIYEDDYNNRYRIERHTFEKSVLLQDLQGEIDKPVPEGDKLEGVRKVMARLADPKASAKYLQELLKANPSREVELKQKALLRANQVKDAESMVLKEHEKKRGIPDESGVTPSNASLSHGAKLLPMSEGLPFSSGRMAPPPPPQYKHRRADE